MKEKISEATIDAINRLSPTHKLLSGRRVHAKTVGAIANYFGVEGNSLLKKPPVGAVKA